MSLRIADQIAVSITINGRDCTLASRPGDQLYIISNSKYQLPQLKIYIDDMQQNFDRTNPLNDGTIVTIFLQHSMTAVRLIDMTVIVVVVVIIVIRWYIVLSPSPLTTKQG